MRGRTRDRWAGAAASLAVHGALLLALVWTWSLTPRTRLPAPVSVTLVDAPFPKRPAAAKAPPVRRPAPAPRPSSASAEEAAPLAAPEPASPRIASVATAPQAAGQALAAGAAPADSSAGDGLSEADIAGAARADFGSAAGDCDMARRLQAALGKDARVLSALARGARRPLLVWNGDWIQRGGEDGKGLAAVREAIMWEIAFAPRACREQSVRGLVLLALIAAPGAPRLVLGARAWRWSDLLAAPGTP